MSVQATNIVKFTVTGIVVCIVIVMWFVGTQGLIVGGILGMVHRNDT